MAIIKLVENYSVNLLRNLVRDSLTYHGEQAILLSLFHVEQDPHINRCPRCVDDAYPAGEEMCPVCFGTGLYDDVTKQGGVKDARRVWCEFTDHVASEDYGQRGVWTPDQREVQCEPFPMLMEHDVIVRMPRWSATHVALADPEFYRVDAVTRDSLRTGSQYGQTWQDIIGQKAQCSLIPHASSGISLYPIKGQIFPAATIEGYPVPRVVVEPDTKVVFYPVGAPSGGVIGGTENWTAPFTWTQDVPAAVWTITHTLGHLPEVTIIVGGEEVDAGVDYPDINTVVISFAEPQEGTVELV